MQRIKKISIYDLNPRYFKDYNEDGIGDLKGLANKFSYLDFLGVDALILQDIVGTTGKTAIENFKTVANDLGTVNDLALVLSRAAKYGIKVFIELKIGSINENHAWFKNATIDQVEELEAIVEFSAKKDDDTKEVKYKFDNRVQGYYPVNEQTREIPLNWKNKYVLNVFLDVIKHWTNLGISGFVLKDFEYIDDKNREKLMNIGTLREMRKFYNSIKEIDHNILVIGKSNIIDLKDAKALVNGITQIFDYFQSTKISTTGVDGKFGGDVISKFNPKKLFKKIDTIAHNPALIVSLGSELTGRITSRWGDDGQFNAESAKTLSLITHLTPASSTFYYGDELGAKNIQLTHLDDFQDENLEMRKKIALENKITEKEFMDAQVLQAPINSRSLMAWNGGKNGGFSITPKTITPVSADYYLNNVEFQFNEKNSILNFNKRLLAFIKTSKFKNLLEKAKFKFSTLLGVLKCTYQANNGEHLTLFANLSDSRKVIPIPKEGSVIFSSYAEKDYNETPKVLEAFESIVVVKGDGFLSLESEKLAKASTKVNTKTKMPAPTTVELEVEKAKEKEIIAKEEMAQKLAKAKKIQEETYKANQAAKKIETQKEQEKARQIALMKEKDKTLKSKVSADEITKLTESEIASTVQIDIDDIDDINEFLKQNK